MPTDSRDAIGSLNYTRDARTPLAYFRVIELEVHKTRLDVSKLV